MLWFSCSFEWIIIIKGSKNTLTLTTSSSVDWHCTASDTSVTVPSVPTVTTFTGTATVFPFSTAVFRISVSCENTHIKHPYFIPSITQWSGSGFPSFIYLYYFWLVSFFIGSSLHLFVNFYIPTFFPYFNHWLVFSLVQSFLSLLSLLHKFI